MRLNKNLLRRLRAVGAVALLLAVIGPAAASAAPLPGAVPGAAPTPASAATTGQASAGQSYGTSVTIRGHGFGHGEGMGQWGAYGYAIQGSTWQQILAHYYGNTAFGSGTHPPNGLNVRLQALDDRPHTSFVQDNGLMATLADNGAGRFRSLTAVETATPGFYAVYGRNDAAVCPGYAGPFNPAGWTLVAPSVSSSTAPGSPSLASGRFLDAFVPGETPSSDAGGLVGLCQPDNSVIYYRGGLRAVNGAAGENRTVNNTLLESYVRGVVPREMPASWGTAAGGLGINALRAQAVAARSFALAGGNRYSYAKICDTQSCQVYGGVAKRAAVGAALQPLEAATSNQAVADTAGVILTRGGVPVSAMYSSSTGGLTAGALFPSVVDAGDDVSPHHSWSVDVPVATIQAAWPAIGTLLTIDVTRRNGLGEWGGRATQVVLRGSAGDQTLTGDQFRLGIGLKSTWILVAPGCNGRPNGTPPPAPTQSAFHPVTPVRIVDTRSGLNAPPTSVIGGCVLAVRITGSGAFLELAATTVTMNLTVVGATGPGFATAYPCAAGRPWVSNLNYGAAEAVPNLVTVPLDGDGYVCIFLQTTGHVVMDLMGWFGGTSGERFRSLPPARIADTRRASGGAGPLGYGGVLQVPVAGVGGVPAGSPVHAAALNVTVTNPVAAGYVTAFPCEALAASSSNLNFGPGRTVANQVVVDVRASGKVCLYSNVPTDLVVDLLGWYGPAGSAATSMFVPLVPNRLLDTRIAQGVPTTAPVTGGTSVTLGVAGRGGVPASGAKAVTLNVTATDSASDGYVTVYPCDKPRPFASNLNQQPGRVVPNLVTVPLAANGTVCLFANTSTHLVADLAGYFV